MSKENNVGNFWFGFLFGAGAVVSGAYFLGTKKGRENLKKAIKFSENLEENIDLLIEKLKKMENSPLLGGRKGSKKSAYPVLSEIINKIKEIAVSK